MNSMSSKFVISHLEMQMGPFDESELKARWGRGELLPIDYVYDDVKQDWVLLADRFAWAKEGAAQEKVQAPVVEPVSATEEAPPPLSEVAARRTTKIATVTKEIPVTPTPAPTPTAILAVPIATAQPSVPAAKGQSVELKDGFGELELPGLPPGQVELALQQGELQLTSPFKINIKSAEPQTIEWNVVSEQTVGEDVEIHVRALDSSNRVCLAYDDAFQIRVNNDANQIAVQLKNGQASIRVQHTKAETWNMTFTYSGNRVLRLPPDRTLIWHPGAAVKLILDGPQEYTAGHSLKVAVRAVDKFGNIAKTFHGTVVLEVKAG